MQFARMVLAREADIVRGMLREGLLTQKRAEQVSAASNQESQSKHMQMHS
jgi:hypothetical protein